MPQEILQPSDADSERSTVQVEPMESEIERDSRRHDWERLAELPHSDEHRQLETEVGRSVSPGFGEMSPAIQEAIAVSAELGDLAVPAPGGRLSRLRQFFRFRRKRTSTATAPTEHQPVSLDRNAETIHIVPPREVIDEVTVHTTPPEDHERHSSEHTLLGYANELEGLIDKAAAEPSRHSMDGEALRKFCRKRDKILWYPNDDVLQTLREGSYTPAQLSAFLGTMRHASEFAPSGYKEKLQRSSVDYVSALKLLDDVPIETVRAMYFSNADSERGNLRYMLRANASSKNVAIAYRAAASLARIHGRSTEELFSSDTTESDGIVKSIRERQDFSFVLAESIPSGPRAGETNRDFEVAARSAEVEYLKFFHLPDELINHIRQAVDSRTMMRDADHNVLTGDKRSVEAGKLRGALARIGENIQTIGLENALKLPEACGIVDFGCYSPEQLERMLKFTAGDSETLEHLRAGDVTVVLIDRLGDHNGASVHIAADIEKPSGRTLFFEIHKPEDIQRYSELLLRSKVKPSVVIASVHGSPGAMFVGDIYSKGFILTNADPTRMQAAEANDGIRRLPIQAKTESQFLKSFARNVMQDSRGIDDDPNMLGRRTFVLKSCSQAVDREIVKDGEITSESTAAALAEAFAGAGPDTVVDVYAADGIARTEPTENGVRYNVKQPDGKTYAYVDAQRFTAHASTVTRTQVAEIKLRRVATDTGIEAA